MTNYKIVMPDELNHHGVKGMRWGVRKDPVQVAQRRIAKEGGTAYREHIGVLGGTSIRNQSGKKMSHRTKRALEKSIKQRDVQEYRKLKQLKRKANSGMTYVGNSASTAMMVSLVNAAGQGHRESAQAQYNKMLIDEGNKYVKSLGNKK